MGAAGSVQAAAQLGVVKKEDGTQAAFPETLTEEQCKQLLAADEWHTDTAVRFREIAVDGTITKEQFIEELKSNKSYYDEEKIKNCVKGLEGAPWKDPEYFKGLGAKFTKIAAKHPEQVGADDWKGSMVREILGILECGPFLEKTLGDQEMLNETGEILLGSQERESLWEIFESSEDDAPDDVRAFIECHTLLASNVKNASQSV